MAGDIGSKIQGAINWLITKAPNLILPTTQLSGTVSNAQLANSAVANLSGTNTGDQTNISGNAATVTTNANLTGNVTSVGNATTLVTGVQASTHSTGIAGIPAFHAIINSTQTWTHAAFTKIQFATKLFDIGSYYDNITNYRYTPLVAGIYFVHVLGTAGTTNVSNTVQYTVAIYKNGSAYKYGDGVPGLPTAGAGSSASALISMNGSTDYLETYFLNGNAATDINANNSGLVNYFCAAWIGPNS